MDKQNVGFGQFNPAFVLIRSLCVLLTNNLTLLINL